MGLFTRKRSGRQAAGSAQARGESRPWPERVAESASENGAFPYVVEGFAEVSEAVRRGHAVVLPREACKVADGISVFEDRSESGASAFGGAGGHPDLVTVSKFEVRTARFLVTDPYSAVGSIELTPKRLQRYMLDERRAVGVALG